MNKKTVFESIVTTSKQIENKKIQLEELKKNKDASMDLSVYVWSVVFDKIHELEREIPKLNEKLRELYIQLDVLNNNRSKRRNDVLKGMGMAV